MSIKKNEPNNFTSHLVELRQRLIYCFLSLFIIFAISYTFAEHIYSFLVQPYANAVQSDIENRRLIFTALQEAFLTYLKVSFFVAIFLTSPVISAAPIFFKLINKTVFYSKIINASNWYKK